MIERNSKVEFLNKRVVERILKSTKSNPREVCKPLLDSEEPSIGINFYSVKITIEEESITIISVYSFLFLGASRLFLELLGDILKKRGRGKSRT